MAVSAGGISNSLLTLSGFFVPIIQPPLGWFLGAIAGIVLGAYIAAAVSQLPPKPAGFAGMGSVLAGLVVSLVNPVTWALQVVIMFILPVSLPASFAVAYFAAKRRGKGDLSTKSPPHSTP